MCATFVSWTTTCCFAVAAASGPACSASACARWASAWACACLICDWLCAATLSAAASCSRSVASRSAAACAMRASFATREASGAESYYAYGDDPAETIPRGARVLVLEQQAPRTLIVSRF